MPAAQTPAAAAALLAPALAAADRWLAVLFQLCFFRGVQLTGVAVGTVASIGFSSLATAVQTWLLLGERPCPRWYASTLLSLACLCCLSGADGTVAWTSLCCPWPPARTYALYFVCTRPPGRQYAPDSIMLVLMGLSGLTLLPVLLASLLYWLASPAGTVTALYLGTVTAALAFSLTTTGLSAPAPRRHIGHAGSCRAAGRCLPGHFSSA